MASVCIVLSGGYNETYGRKTRRAEPGTIIVHPEGEHHSNRHDAAQVRLLTIEIHKGQLSDLTAESPILSEPWHATDLSLTVLGRRLCVEARQASPDTALVIEGLVMEILARIGPVRDQPKVRAPWLARVKDYLDASVGVVTRMEDLAQIADVHPVHLARVFRQADGCSIGAYKRRLQVAHALLLLDGSRSGISSIAAESGFADQSHMTRLVHAHTGLPPGALRRMG